MAKELKDEKVLKEYVENAEDLPHLPIEPLKFGPVMKALGALSDMAGPCPAKSSPEAKLFHSLPLSAGQRPGLIALCPSPSCPHEISEIQSPPKAPFSETPIYDIHRSGYTLQNPCPHPSFIRKESSSQRINNDNSNLLPAPVRLWPEKGWLGPFDWS